MSIRHDTLKARAKKALFERRHDAIEIFLQTAAEGDSQMLANWRGESLSLVDQGQRLIDRWDVRKVGKLIELFPEIVPTSWHRRPLTAEYSDTGDWIVNAH